MSRQRAGGSSPTNRIRSSTRRGLRLRVSHRRAESWQPQAKAVDMLYDHEIVGGSSNRPSSKIKRRRRKSK